MIAKAFGMLGCEDFSFETSDLNFYRITKIIVQWQDMKTYSTFATLTRGEFQRSGGRDDSVGPAPRTRSTSGSAEDEHMEIMKSAFLK